MSLSLSLANGNDALAELRQELASAATAALSPLLGGRAPSQDGAGIINDLAHVSSDLIVLIQPETIVLRLGVVIGRILGMVADYIEDYTIRDDELAFDIPLLAASLFLLWRSAAPVARAYFTELDGIDLDVFEQCFRPVGVSLLQFKSMKATGCFEWIECDEGTVLVDEQCPELSEWEYLYWQYEGEVIRSFRGKVFSITRRRKGKSIDSPKAWGIIGDTRFLIKIEEEAMSMYDRERTGAKNVTSSNLLPPSKSPPLLPIATTVVGTKGAKLLRIDSYQLFDLMDHDERLESSIRRLLLKSLKRKIGNLLQTQEKLFLEREQFIHEKRYDKIEETMQHHQVELTPPPV